MGRFPALVRFGRGTTFMLGLFRITTAIQRLAVARLMSVTGRTAAFAALNYVVYQRTRSATWLAATLLSRSERWRSRHRSVASSATGSTASA